MHGLFAATPAEHVLQLPNVDRDPIPRWSFGRVTLIGDAAHPMQPVGAQAGSQAVVDGRVLAASLMARRDPAEALTRYQNERIAAMNDMIVRNRNLGLESILQTAEERAPQGFAHIHDVLSQEELEHTAISFKKAAGFDVETVNSRDSFVERARKLIRAEPIAGLDRYAGRSWAGHHEFSSEARCQAASERRRPARRHRAGLGDRAARSKQPAPPAVETYPSGWTVDPPAHPHAGRHLPHALAVVAARCCSRPTRR